MDRPDLIQRAGDRLRPIERFQIRFVQRTFEPGRVDRAVRWCQRALGSTWIHHFTKHVRQVHGLDRLPALDEKRSFICVSNHRSFFDLYVITAELVRRGLPHRIVFPVRAHFFYDRPVGLLVNGVMSFFAMYPPIFREKERQMLNVTSLDELSWLLAQGGVFAGLHPEGTRKLDDDPYTFLPAQPGVGRVIHASRATVLPVFINGLGNDLVRQVKGNFDGTGPPVMVVFGKPIDFGELMDKPGALRVYKKIGDRTLEAISELGQEEKKLRAAFDSER